MRDHAAPTVKLRLAALRHLFDWQNAGAGPEEARALLDAIDVIIHAGLLDRALIARPVKAVRLSIQK